MAEYLASIFGTEKDKVNCSFYFKIGACRHGARCSRIHNKPAFSQTVLLQNLYHNPQISAQPLDGSHREFLNNISEQEVLEHFDNFYEDVFVELEEKYGDIEEMIVCDNLGDHLVGNVYVKFMVFSNFHDGFVLVFITCFFPTNFVLNQLVTLQKDLNYSPVLSKWSYMENSAFAQFYREEDAEKAVENLNSRWFAGRPIYAELSPVTDFSEACCRQYEVGECKRSGFCNFMHVKPISRELRRELFSRYRRHRSRSRSRDRRRSRSRSWDRRRRSHSRERRRGAR
ncbi:Splicing factor U2af subunit [Araneus ventricosus]|uniref:Splicing factor U2af subunit n=1 Tax=Araneus ventricosus TaxID=182803 RepID=A0A4Y2FE33_ARAVE|nr:Splicing factor U2af subunit [Araneus ventricosus]